MKTVLSIAIVAVLLGPMSPAGAAFSDVPSSHWAAGSIRYVADDRDWILTAGGKFYPSSLMLRKVFARSLARAFAPDEPTDPSIVFTDLPASDGYYRYANVAVKLGWLTAPGGTFAPTGSLSKAMLDRALVRALGLTAEATALNKVSGTDGYRFKHPWHFAYVVLANVLALHHNHPSANESPELAPTRAVTRADAAYSLHQAARAGSSWRMWEARKFSSIELPTMSAARKKAVEFAFAAAGYPYVWAGEWFRATPDGYCCGAQRVGGYDCSGFVWWTLKSPAGGYDNTAWRGYKGWPVSQRSSADMARAAATRLKYEQLMPMDVVFFDTDGAGTDYKAVDHAGLYLGRGWMIHSSGSRAGVTINWIGDGWWREHLLWGRRVVPSTA